MDIWSNDDDDYVQMRASAEQIVQNIRRDSMEGIVIPDGWELSLLSTGGQRQFDTTAIIERYDSRIAMTCMADFILLGHQQVGSFALSSDKTKMFAMAIGSYLNIICEVFNNQAIPALIDINGDHFSGITDYPKLVHGDVEDPNLDKLGDFINKMVSCGILLPDEGMEDFARNQAGLPERIDDWDEARRTAAQSGGTDENGQQKKPKRDPSESDDDIDIEDDDGDIEKAKARLGRKI